jgi:RNA polymerase sigma factor (TIGR02999 family)
MTDVTQILNQIEQGDPSASEKLLPLVYEELRKLAGKKMVGEKPGQTLQGTALVHEAYLRLVGGPDSVPQHWEGRRHFFAAAAKAMQRILVENARRKNRLKHGGEYKQQELLDVPGRPGIPINDLLDLDAAIEKLQQEEPEKAEVVRLRFFVGLNHELVAEALGISEVTVRRHWRYARAWLRREMGRDPIE